MVTATITLQGKTFQLFPNLVRNDTGFTIQFNVKLNDEITAFDLTGATPIKFKTKGLDETVLKIDGTCTITDATNGICTYVVASGDLDTAKVYEAELEITNGSEINTVKLGRMNVVEDLP